MACSSAEQVEMRPKIFSERESATIPSCYFVSFVVKILVVQPLEFRLVLRVLCG